MRRVTKILFFLFILSGIIYYFYLSPPITGNAIKEYHNITRVIDGDTVVLDNGNKVRFLGINTPEKKVYDIFSNASYEFIKQFEGKKVLVESSQKDKYGRNLGYIFYDGKMINEEILRKGLAHIFIYTNDKYSQNLRNAEEYAIENQIGIWKKSPNVNCLSLIKFNYTEAGERCTNKEQIILENNCSTIQIYLKDDATHDESLNLTGGLTILNFSCVFNDAGDSLYIWDKGGLLVFDRYSNQ